MTEPIVLGHLLGGRVDLPLQGRELTREEPVGVQERCPPDRGRRVVDEKVDSQKMEGQSTFRDSPEPTTTRGAHVPRQAAVVDSCGLGGACCRKQEEERPKAAARDTVLRGGCCEGSGHRLSSGPPRSPRLLLALPVACRRPACPLCLPAAAAPCRLRGLNGQRARWLASMPRGLWVAPDETVI